MKSIQLFGLALGVLLLPGLTGCKEDALQEYIGGDNIGFWIHAKSHSLYGASPEELPVDIIELDLHIMGFTAPYDREVAVEVVEDEAGTPQENKLTTATPGQYRILDGVVPANSTTGKLRIEVTNLPMLAYDELRIHVRVVENNHFKPGLKENQYINVLWSARLLRPQTWNAMRFFFCSTYSTQVYRLYMQATGLKEFWYYNAGPDPVNNPEDAKVNPEMGYAWGRTFGDLVRKYNAEHPGEPMVHDDGDRKGEPIVPIY